MKRILTKISGVILAFIGLFNGCCFADLVMPSDIKPTPEPPPSVAPVKTFNFTPIIIGIIAAIIVALVIIVLVSGKKNKEENK